MYWTNCFFFLTDSQQLPSLDDDPTSEVFFSGVRKKDSGVNEDTWLMAVEDSDEGKEAGNSSTS